jgi:hypothetical protein
MAGSTSVTHAVERYGLNDELECRKITVSFTADAADGSIPDTSVNMVGWLVKVITNPGSTAPTDNWDITLKDPLGSDLDAAGGLLLNRDTTNTEQVYPVISGAVTPLFLAGDYGVAMAGNSVNSATGTVTFYLVDSL